MASISDVLDRLLQFMQNQSAPRRTAEDADVSDRTQRRLHETEFEADVARRRLQETEAEYRRQQAAGVVSPQAEEDLRRAELRADRAEADARQARADADRAEAVARRRDTSNAPSFGTRTVRGWVESANAGFADPQGLVRRGEEEGSRFKAAAGHLFDVARRPGLGGIASAGRSAGEVAGYLPVVGGVAENVVKLGAALVETTDLLRKWGQSLNQANLQFAQFSPHMAQVAARDVQRKIALDMERGERRAATAERLSQAQFEAERNITPWEDLFDNLKGELASSLLEGLFGDSGILGGVNEIARKMGVLTERKDVPTVLGDLQAAAVNGLGSARPPRFPGDILPVGGRGGLGGRS